MRFLVHAAWRNCYAGLRCLQRAAELQLRLAAMPVRIVSVHLPPRGWRRRRAARCWFADWSRLTADIDGGAGRNLVVLGDFNAVAGIAPCTQPAEHLPHSGCPRGQTLRMWAQARGMWNCLDGRVGTATVTHFPADPRGQAACVDHAWVAKACDLRCLAATAWSRDAWLLNLNLSWLRR